MRLQYVLLILFIALFATAGCENDSEDENNGDVIDSCDIHGKVTNKETGEPVEGASVNIGGQTALTDSDGRYVLIAFQERMTVIATAENYVQYEDSLSLKQKLLIYNIALVPVDSPSAHILEVLEAFSKDIEALDPDKIPSIQSYLSEDYTAEQDDLATAFGIAAGVIPADYDTLPDTITTVIGKYDKLDFNFVNPSVEIVGDSATVLMRFEVYAETKPPEPSKWEIAVDGKLELQKINGDWKISYWMLVSDFHKFEQKPL